MKKRNFNMLLSFVIGAAFVLLTYSGALATGGECPGTTGNTCYTFDLGYTIEVMDAGIIDQDTGLQKWTYKVSKKKSANANMIYLGMEKEINIDLTKITVNYDYVAPCEGNSNENIGIGDCLRQYIGFSPNFPTSNSGTITYYIKPVNYSTITPIFMKGGSYVEPGAILGPAADLNEVLESTFDIQQSQDGSAIAVKMDRDGNVLELRKCVADCGDYPNNFDTVNLDTNSFTLDEQYYCVEVSVDNVAFPPNTTLTLDDETVLVHCGKMEFLEQKTSFQFDHRVICKYVNGVSRCVNY
jgi:hypothetical protein